MSEVKVNKISPRTNCGTVQLGDSGDTITIPAGATITNNGTQTGFGRTGTVDWDTTAKTASFTAVSGNGYFINTTSGAITVTLPASPSAGDIVAVSDYAQTSGTNNITLARNGSNIEGDASDLVIQNNGVSMTFVYADATKGWKVVNAGAESDKEPVPEFIQASGGTITECGNFKIHTFTGPGTFTVSQVSSNPDENTVGYMVVAGGGGGGYCAGGGGGAGGFREGRNVPVDNFTASPLVADAPTNAVTVAATSYPITVGGGGSGATGGPSNGGAGNVSTFSSISSAGGGGGGSRPASKCGASGGSGGGDSADAVQGPIGGAGNTPPVSPSQGFPGGSKLPANPGFNDGGMGGGGATVAGEASQNPFSPSVQAPDGGAGATTSITGSSSSFSGGGGGGGYINCGTATSGAGGLGGGGNGATPSGPGSNGTANTGGGAGGGGNGGQPTFSPGGAGGSGIVVIRYKFQ